MMFATSQPFAETSFEFILIHYTINDFFFFITATPNLRVSKNLLFSCFSLPPLQWWSWCSDPLLCWLLKYHKWAFAERRRYGEFDLVWEVHTHSKLHYRWFSLIVKLSKSSNFLKKPKSGNQTGFSGSKILHDIWPVFNSHPNKDDNFSIEFGACGKNPKWGGFEDF